MRALLILTTLFMLSGCEQPQVTSQRFLAFGTLIDVTIADRDEALTDKGMAAVVEDFEYMHETYHPWHAGSLGRVNSLLPTQTPFSSGPSLIPLITSAKDYAARTHQLFNPAIGGLIKLWGFNQDDMSGLTPPAPADIDKWLNSHPTMEDIEISGVTVTGHNPDLILDFGGFAKGYAIDFSLQRLKEMGIRNAIINAGGDLKVLGDKYGTPWRIGIRHPRQDSIMAVIDLHDGEAIFTSGDYERFYEKDGKRYHHILDPRTGYPTEHAQSTTVIYDNAAAADAFATALMVGGPDLMPQLLKENQLKQAMLIDENGEIHITHDLAERIQWIGEHAPLHYVD